MNLYAETSAVVGWLLGEAMGSSVRRALQNAQSVFSSDLTLIEGDRVLYRAAATGRISPDEVRRARTLLASRADHWSIHAITPRVVELARGPFPGEPIRALDAIHLATALVIRDIYPDLRVLSLDQRVRENAVALGFEVVPGGSGSAESQGWRAETR